MHFFSVWLLMTIGGIRRKSEPVLRRKTSTFMLGMFPDNRKEMDNRWMIIGQHSELFCTVIIKVSHTKLKHTWNACLTQ